MKRQRSYGEDVDAVGDRGFVKDWGRRDQDLDRPTSHRRFYPKSDSVRRGYYDRVLDDDRDLGRVTRKRFDKEADGFDRRKGFERYERMMPVSSPRSYCGPEKVYRSDSFSRREFPKGFRSGREPPRRKENVPSSWRRPVPRVGKDANEEAKRGRSEDRGSSKSSAGSRDVGKSPPWSKDSVGEQSKDVGKSPPWSKDSAGEQSKSVETEKTEEANGESNRGNEMEEGELQPDPQPLPEQELQKEAVPAECETESVMDVEPKIDVQPKGEASNEEKLELGGKEEDGMLESVAGASDLEEGKKLSDHEANAVVKLGEMEGDVEADGCKEEEENTEGGCKEEEENTEGGRPDSPSPNHEAESRTGEDMNVELAIEKPLLLEEEQKQERNVMNLRTEVEGTSLPSSSKAAAENVIPEVPPRYTTDELNDKRKDKGKGLAVSPSDEGDSVEAGAWVTRDLFPVRDDAMEGPSSRNYQPFQADFMRQDNTHNSDAADRDENLKMEPLELSLGLPGVSKASASHCVPPAPTSPKHARNSPSHGRSVHSLPTTYHTGSDGFTTSISFSGSQTLIHNPSCSLTQNSLENYEQSVGSRPIFQGFDRVPQGGCHGESSNEPKWKDISFVQWTLQNGKASLHSSQAIQGRQMSSGTTGIPDGMDRHQILARQSSGQLRQDDAKSPACSNGSHETRSEHRKHGRHLVKERTNSGQLMIGEKEMGQWVLSDRTGFEGIISGIASEQIHTMAKRIEAMTDQSIAYLKESIFEIIKDAAKQEKLQALQEALQRRSDLTFETLSTCHRTQLEIFVAIKTGLHDFLWQTTNIQSSDLIEIFLNLKCRNLQCGSVLPVDECDCKICVQKNGFCSMCMCLVCSKFDMASNTCSWVGCDVCLHWCHADCGLQNRHIKNGRSIMGAQGVNEMQFHCVACGHTSEMFGFVKDVFKTCAKDWKAETLSKELEYVRKIFIASDDARGKKLHDVAVQMLMKLQHDSNLAEVYNTIMVFLNESDSKYRNNPAAISPMELSQKNPGEGSNGIAVASQETAWPRPALAEKAPAIENSGSILRRFDWDQLSSPVGFQSSQKKADKRPVMDELDTIVRIKEAEAEMFQARADAARREAESLKCISNAKNEKIEQDYANRISKLCLAEAEERRKRKLEELKALEKANLEYSNMKTRMEADIKNLLLQMETTKRNLGT